jgi:LmbE family N-acetylglucosaminyl deacetylase
MDRRALVIGAHPDDIEFGCGATVAQWVQDGWDVRYVIVTSGQRGSQDPEATPEDMAAVREAESREAARICGVEDVTFLRYLDADLIAADPLALRLELSRQFRRHRPHRLVTLEPALLPTERFVNHPDHRTVGTAALDITVTGGTTGAIFPELALEEGLPAWRELEEVWLMGPAPGPVAVDVSATVERKIAALEAHASQIGGWQVGRFVAERLRAAGEPHGLEYAETFRVISFRRE